MTLVINIITVLIAILHVYFLVLEMFLWDKPLGRKTFNLTIEQANHTKVLAANQGLYNGFFAAGLLLSVYWGETAYPFKIFLLVCILIAGLYGAVTASKKILFVQALPAAIVLVMMSIQFNTSIVF